MNTTQQSLPAARTGKIRAVVMVASGNFLEMFDFMVFGYYAPAIARAFFPASNEFTSLLLALMTFGAGFLMRPVGAVLLGAYVDRHGRRRGLLLTLSLMAVGTLAIAVMPTYAEIGVAAPLLVLAARLVQGLSAGVELGGVSVYLAEIATPGRRGFYVAWQSASQQVAVVFAAVVGIVVTAQIGSEQLTAWGWRIPFFIGSALLPFLLLMRRRLEETPEFLARRRRPTLRETAATLRANWSLVAGGTLIATMTTVFFYMITAYTPTYGSRVLQLSALDSLQVTLCVGLANFVLLPTMGALSDRVGRVPLLLACSGLAIVVGYPVLHWLTSAPSFGRLLGVELLFAAIYATYNAAMVVYLTEIMPAEVRTTAFSLAYSLATALFGGFTPAISTYLIQLTGDRAIPGAWLAAAGVCGFVATAVVAARRRVRTR